MDASLVRTRLDTPVKWGSDHDRVLGKNPWSICGSPHKMTISAGYGCILHDCFFVYSKRLKDSTNYPGLGS